MGLAVLASIDAIGVEVDVVRQPHGDGDLNGVDRERTVLPASSCEEKVCTQPVNQIYSHISNVDEDEEET